MQKTAEGHVRLRVSGGRGKAEGLAEAIKVKIPGATVANKQKRTILHLSNLGEDCEKDDIVQAMRQASGKPEMEVTVSNIRPAYRDP